MNPEEAPKTPPEETPPQSVESPPAHSPAPPDKPKSKSRPVKVYLTVLFCVALLLLLISFVMQQRNHLALQDLNDSISNTQEIADLQLENQRLQYELEDKQALEEQVQAQQKQVEALEWLRQIEAATRTSYTRARELVEAFEETGLEEQPAHRICGGGGGLPCRYLPFHLRHAVLREKNPTLLFHVKHRGKEFMR